LKYTTNESPAATTSIASTLLLLNWPLLVLEEAQNLSASALEELRFSCPPGINRAIISRLGFALALSRLEPVQSRDYVSARLVQSAFMQNPFEDQALELLIQAAGGLPRAIEAAPRMKPTFDCSAIVNDDALWLLLT
jgi:hypothetical protein